ncbi:MAG: hypothetical protein NDF54_06830 [archaeon GB-1867-035]|nr:hypothetical protein [Candidatus Culexmicrobium profundum]
MLIQLKPREESFTTILFQRLRKLDTLLLCEGKTETKVIKAIIKKLGIQLHGNVGVTDSEGINQLYNLTYILTLLISKTFKKVRKLAILLDSEQMAIEERVKSLVDSLKAKGYNINNIEKTCHQTYKINGIKPPIYVSINGIHSLNHFQKHTIEDHGAILLSKLNPNIKEKIKTAKDAQEIIHKEELVPLIEKSKPEQVKQAFNHIYCLLNQISK